MDRTGTSQLRVDIDTARRRPRRDTRVARHDDCAIQIHVVRTDQSQTGSGSARAGNRCGIVFRDRRCTDRVEREAAEVRCFGSTSQGDEACAGSKVGQAAYGQVSIIGDGGNSADAQRGRTQS